MSKYLKTSEAAEYLGIPESTLRTWRERSFGPPAFRLGKRNYRYSLDKLILWVAQREAQGTKGDSL